MVIWKDELSQGYWEQGGSLGVLDHLLGVFSWRSRCLSHLQKIRWQQPSTCCFRLMMLLITLLAGNLDLRSSYCQMAFTPEVKEKTAFIFWQLFGQCYIYTTEVWTVYWCAMQSLLCVPWLSCDINMPLDWEMGKEGKFQWSLGYRMIFLCLCKALNWQGHSLFICFWRFFTGNDSLVMQ